MSSRLDRELGIVEVTAPVYSTMSVGHLFSVAGSQAELRALSKAEAAFGDYLARLTLSQNGNGRAHGEGVTVRPPEGALREAIMNGTVHPSLAEPPTNGSAPQDAPVDLETAA